MSDLVPLVAFVLIGSVYVALMNWWFEARTHWLSRLSARGLVHSHVEPAPPYGPIASTKWLLRQRLSPRDLFTIGRLERQPDDDRVTETWRIRTRRRKKILIGGALVYFALLLAVFILNDTASMPVILISLALAGLVSATPGVMLYRRLRKWGSYGDV